MMKFCPYCGAELVNGAASFCSECGKSLPNNSERQTETREQRGSSSGGRRRSSHPATRQKTRKPPEKKKTARTTEAEKSVSQPADGYDGYYDDVLPVDVNRQREGMDKNLIKKVALIAGGVLLIIVLCLAALYLL